MTPPQRTRRSPPKLYRQDMVRRDASSDGPQEGSEELGIVLRTWHEEADLLAEGAQPPDLTGHEEFKDILRPLQEGEVGVFWQSTGVREILPEDKVPLCDRLFSVGDIVKESLSSPQSGVVIGLSTTCSLLHSLTASKLDNVPGTKVANARRFHPGDHVIHNNWFGNIEEIMLETRWVTEEGRTFRTYDFESDYQTGTTAENPWKEPEGAEPILCRHPRDPPYTELQGVPVLSIDVRHRACWVHWLAVNQMLTPEEQDACPKPPAYWAKDIDQLTLVKPMLGAAHAVGDRVIFRDAQDLHDRVPLPLIQSQRALMRYISNKEGSDVDLSQFPDEHELVVCETSTQVSVRWQDGSVTQERTTSLVPYSDLIDTHEAWPGEMVTWRNQADDLIAEGAEAASPAKKLVIVQSFDAEERTAVVAEFRDQESKGESIVVPALELDVMGHDLDEEATFWQHGLRRGDDVLVRRSQEDGTEKLPRIPRLGAPAEVSPGWSKKLDATLSEYLATATDAREPAYKLPPLSVNLSASEKEGLAWYGIVVDLELDGRARVLLPGGDSVLISPARLTKLDDYYGQDFVPPGEEDNMDMDDGYALESEEDEAKWTTEDGQEIEDEGMDEWEDDESAQAKAGNIANKEQASTVVAPALPTPPPPASIVRVPPSPIDTVTYSLSSRGPPPPSSGDDWALFEIHDTVPQDHHYANQLALDPSRAFHSRLKKEHKSLSTALPSNILVRTYADRLDLMRVVIFGSPGTPYADGTFLFDFHLEDFPARPPKGFFHSWTNGTRISPNLYENGKICLSLLGTWGGESSESWQPSKSSLLQLFVSIASLVLVDEPYYTEPAFERLKGTEEGRVNARLYKESALVSTLNFVRRALVRPPVGFEEQVQRYYYGTSSSSGSSSSEGQLANILADGKRLLEISEEVKGRRKQRRAEGLSEEKYEMSDTSVEPLSGGAVLVSQRTLQALQALQEGRAAAAAAAAAATTTDETTSHFV